MLFDNLVDIFWFCLFFSFRIFLGYFNGFFFSIEAISVSTISYSRPITLRYATFYWDNCLFACSGATNNVSTFSLFKWSIPHNHSHRLFTHNNPCIEKCFTESAILTSDAAKVKTPIISAETTTDRATFCKQNNISVHYCHFLVSIMACHEQNCHTRLILLTT